MQYRLIRRWHKTGHETRQAKTYADFNAAAVAALFMEAFYRQHRRPCSVSIETVPDALAAEAPDKPAKAVQGLSVSAASASAGPASS